MRDRPTQPDCFIIVPRRRLGLARMEGYRNHNLGHTQQQSSRETPPSIHYRGAWTLPSVPHPAGLLHGPILRLPHPSSHTRHFLPSASRGKMVHNCPKNRIHHLPNGGSGIWHTWSYIATNRIHGCHYLLLLSRWVRKDANLGLRTGCSCIVYDFRVFLVFLSIYYQHHCYLYVLGFFFSNKPQITFTGFRCLLFTGLRFLVTLLIYVSSLLFVFIHCSLISFFPRFCLCCFIVVFFVLCIV